MNYQNADHKTKKSFNTAGGYIQAEKQGLGLQVDLWRRCCNDDGHTSGARQRQLQGSVASQVMELPAVVFTKSGQSVLIDESKLSD